MRRFPLTRGGIQGSEVTNRERAKRPQYPEVTNNAVNHFISLRKDFPLGALPAIIRAVAIATLDAPTAASFSRTGVASPKVTGRVHGWDNHHH